MNALKQSIVDALESATPIPRPLVREWIQRAADVETDALLYRLTEEAWNRIDPGLETAETCALIERYLFRCIKEDPQSDTALSRYEAAHALEAWCDHLAGMDDGREILQGVVDAITTLFLTSDADVRRAIETGFLEHLLEQPAMRPLFSHWADDDRLREAWRLALAWGEAHPDFAKSMRATLRAVQTNEE